ncbi:hypothetical protein F4820DRAFT_423025 [Hypoxylon rubiginosum]|uniref:Uncharacterized protein n=1 Tax=Hypoxylon rubiginosum TaxID=110542 RepID=A0ACB9YZK4_9PEZI|nr:hypothetical protein F4820DRAFT_423025 [Hypoxylon rubiginosum]
MRSLLRAALPRACSARTTKTAITSIATTRTFSSLPSLRPTILASTSTITTAFRSRNLLSAYTPAPSSTGAVLDLVPKSSVTAHPSTWGPAQVRFGPRPTMARTSRLVRKRRHGFLSRLRARNGRRTLQRRREKKRSVLSN